MRRYDVCVLLRRETRRYSGGVRVGQSEVVATEWRSDTSMVCKVGAGMEGSLAVVMSLGEVAGSMSAGASYDVAVLSLGAVRNKGTTGGGSMSVSGAGFGTSR